ncbi:MAG: putative peptidoglycan glycosyltransferase FtsW [bacterium]
MAEETKKYIDWYLFLATALLMLLSLAFVYTASATFSQIEHNSTEYVFFSHTIKTLIGFIVMIAAILPDYKFYKKISKPLMVISIVALVFVFAFAAEKGAHRWIRIGFISFQPSDLARIALILHLANLLARNNLNIKSFKEGFLPMIVWMSMCLILIGLEPNMSTVMVFFIISVSMMFIGNVNLKHLLLTFAVILVMVVGYSLTAEYRVNRLLAYFSSSDTTAVANPAVKYQLDQSLLALGNGGLSGVGLGQSRQSQLFLPESFSDFIFSIVGEELGFIGLFLILSIYIFIIYRGFKIAKNAPDLFSYFVATGITISFSIYVLVNIGVNCGLLPTTGLPLPFISHGGTAVLFNSLAIGILLNISSQTGVFSKKGPVIIDSEETPLETSADPNILKIIEPDKDHNETT